MKDVFSFRNYRDFLKTQFPRTGEMRGRRQKLAKILSCQTSFISLVLTERVHMNEDMVFLTAQFLGLSGGETDFLLLTFHFERAASHSLKSHYREKMNLILKGRSEVNARIDAPHEVNLETQALYYSDWHFSAIHTLVLNENFRQPDLIARKLAIDTRRVEEALEFLQANGFINRTNGAFAPGVARLHLNNQSPFIVQHHRNWHLEAMRALSYRREKDVNYSGVLSMSKKDVAVVRETLLEVISQIEKQIAPSPDEEISGIVIDFFPYA